MLGAELRTLRAGRSAIDRYRIGRALIYLHAKFGWGRYVFGWLPDGNHRPMEVTMRSGMRLLLRRSDVISLVEQVGMAIYDIDVPGPEPVNIVDLGANVGLATIALAARYPDARFICVEPAADTRELLRHNTVRNGIKAEILDVAIVGASGRVALHVGEHPGGTWVEPAGGGDIDGLSLRAMLDRVGIDHVGLLKMDIKGWEQAVFENASEWATDVDTVMCELHGDLSPERVQALLGDYGLVLHFVSPRAVCLTRLG